MIKKIILINYDELILITHWTGKKLISKSGLRVIKSAKDQVGDIILSAPVPTC